MPPHLSVEERWAIISLHKFADWSNYRIAQTLHCSHHTVADTLKRYEETGDVSDRERSGRPPLLESHSSEYKVALDVVKKHRQYSAAQLAKYLRLERGVDISASTMKNFLHRLHFHPVHFRKRPLLTEKHREKRLRFALENHGEEWDDVIFTDEKFFLFGPEGVRLWKRPQEEEICGFVPMERTKFMVWGGIWKGGKTGLFIAEDSIDSGEYQNILWEYLISPQHEEFLQYMRVLQDNAAPHTSASTRDFLDNFEVELVEDYPPMSPDINPIERVWGWMVNYINHRDAKTPHRYQRLIEEAWEMCPQKTIDAFIFHVPSILKEIEEKKGGNTTN
jgi:transposase